MRRQSNNNPADMYIFGVAAKDVHGATNQYRIDQKPTICPLCGNGVKALLVTAVQVPVFGHSDLNSKLEIVWQCPIDDCGGLFIAIYYNTKSLAFNSNDFALIKTIPQLIEQHFREIPDMVKAVSPDFCDILHQALIVDALGYVLVSGPGLRKALEFLIKDFLCNEASQAEREKIIGMTLQSCIANKVADANLKAVAERAAWLGNDATHYYTQWTAHDIQDLKTLIQLSVHWIDSVLLTEKYTKDMEKKNK
jgi:hypothetical protein